MHTFAKKAKATQHTTSATSMMPVRIRFGQSNAVSSILHLQRTTGKRAVQRLLPVRTEDVEASSVSSAATGPAYDFSRMPVHTNLRKNIQLKLKVNSPGDIYEQEADRVADQVMRMPEPRLQRTCACEGGCHVCRQEQVTSKQMHFQAKNTEASNLRKIKTPSIIHDVLRSSGQRLETTTRAFMESRFGHDFSKVRVYTGSAAQQSSRALNARAYTIGSNIVFGPGHFAPHTEPGRRLLAHELTHVIQQSSGGLRLDLKEAEATANITQQIIRALNTPDPIAGVGDYDTAYNLLNGLSMPVMLRVLNELAAQFMLEVLISRGPPQDVDVPRISAAITLVRLANTDAANIKQAELESFANNAQSLPIDQQQDMLNFASTVRRISAETREGLAAMMTSEISGTSSGGLSPAIARGVKGPVNPGRWNPPGNQPIPFYIGNEAHIGIAQNYTAEHPGDPVFTNFISLSTILQQAAMLGFSPNTKELSSGELALKPDILNLAPSRLHLFEIKPTSLQSEGRAKACMYVKLLKKAGMSGVKLGPISEPGTNGAISAPGGVYLFETPEAGVIVYQYLRQRVVPVRVPEGEPAWELRWRLAPLTPQQQAAIVNTITVGAGGMILLYLMMLLLAPAGV